jgi:iron complex outermembrane receptor protein
MNHRPSRPRKALGSPIHLAILTLLTGVQFCIQPAQAQEAPAAQDAQAQAASPGATQVQAAPTNQGADKNSTVIPEVYVTATKRTTSLQRTPVAVTALNAAALEDAHVQTIQDVVNLVPGFQATTQGDHGVITMTLRGVGNDSAKTEYADPEVATFIDGIYSPRPEGASALLFDLEGIEVLRGPQGTLWGRNSSVGAVNMQTVKPELGSNSGNFEIGYGNYSRVGARGAFNIPLGDKAAMRIAIVHEQHDGYVDYQKAPNVSIASQQAAVAAYNLANPLHPVAFQPINTALYAQNGPKYNSQDQSALRLSLLVAPTPQLKWNVSFEKFLDRGTPNMNLMQTPRAGEDFWSALIDTAPSVHRDSNSLRSRIDYALTDSISLAYIAGYSSFRGSSTFDQDGGVNVPTSFTTGGPQQSDNVPYSHYSNYSHELEVQSTGKREVDWLLGLYYAAENNSIRFDIPIINGTQEGTINWQGSFVQPKETVESKAVFGQSTWNVNDSLHLTGGIRYTDDKRTNQGGVNYGWDGNQTIPQTPLNPNVNAGAPGSGYTGTSNTGEFTGNKVTWLARVGYDIDRNNMVYGSVSTGYKSGGVQDGGKPYGAETLTNYEIGSKSTFFGGTVKMNNALYYEKFKGFQFSAPVTNPDGTHSLSTYNADGAKIYGFESEMAAKITRDDKVQLTLALTHSELEHLIGGSNDYQLPVCAVPGISNCLDVTGNTMPHTPHLSAQIQFQHTFHLGSGTLTPRISTHYETSSYLSVFNLGDPDRQKSYTRTDLGLRYDSTKAWYVDAFVRNAEDKKIKTSAQDPSGIWQAQYLPPITYGFNAGINF